MAHDTVLSMLELELESEHTRSSCMLGMPLGSWVERNSIVALEGLGIRVGLEAFPVKEERVVPR